MCRKRICIGLSTDIGKKSFKTGSATVSILVELAVVRFQCTTANPWGKRFYELIMILRKGCSFFSKNNSKIFLIHMKLFAMKVSARRFYRDVTLCSFLFEIHEAQIRLVPFVISTLAISFAELVFSLFLASCSLQRTKRNSNVKAYEQVQAINCNRKTG